MLNYLSGSTRGRGTVSPTVLAVLGLLAYRTLKGKGRLAELLQGSPTATGAAPAGNFRAAGLSSGALLGGLKELLDRFRQNNPASLSRVGYLRVRTSRFRPASSSVPWARTASTGSRPRPA